MALIEGCKHELELTIPSEEVTSEMGRVVEKIRQRAHLKGFRPGKAPTGMIKSLYKAEVNQEVLDALIPKHLQAACDRENLTPVSRPEVKDLHFHDNEDVHLKVTFEVNPEIDLKEVRGLEAEYAEPEVTEADVEARLEELRQSKAEYVNIDPRPAEDGDHALVELESIAGIEGPAMKQEDINIEIGHADTFTAFSEALRGALPGDIKEAEIDYPENYAEPRLAGHKVRFKLTLKSLRMKELPELNDEFAKDMGDFQTLEELREEIRKSIFRERDFALQNKAKDQLIEKLIDSHDFPAPEVYVEQQVQNNFETQLRQLAAQGVDVGKLKIDWSKVKESQRDRAVRDVRASMLLDKIATVESIGVMQEEVDRQVQLAARQERQPVAAVRKRMEEDGSLRRIASRIRTEKTLNFLFEHATKIPPKPAEETIA